MIDKETKNIIATEQNLAMTFIKKACMWIEEDKQNAVFLYGAGTHLHWVILLLQRFRIPVKMIIDTWKTGVYDDIPIVRFEDFRTNSQINKDKCWFVVSAPSAGKSIIKSIREHFPTSRITCCDMQLYTDFIPDIEEYRKYLLQHWDEFNQLSDSFVDERSRETLECVLKGRITGDITYYQKCYSLEPYYPREIISFTPEEVMVELGGYDGATLLRFIELCPRFSAAYCFEPDADLLPKLYEIQKEQAQDGKNIIIVNKGAWDKTEKKMFAKDNINRDRGTLMFDNVGGNYIEVDVTTVDETVKEKISFMKLDIEGAEIRALRGAEKQIQKNKPKLAICVYHKPEDILDIWKYLKSLVPEYCFYLRHHNQNSGTDTIMYAIAEKEFMMTL